VFDRYFCGWLTIIIEWMVAAIPWVGLAILVLVFIYEMEDDEDD